MQHSTSDMNMHHQQMIATEQVEDMIQDIQEQVDTRDERILEELKNIHNAILVQTEHYIKQLENQSLSQKAPVQEIALDTVENSLPDNPVSLEIQEPHDIPKEQKETNVRKRMKKFGKKRKGVNNVKR